MSTRPAAAGVPVRQKYGNKKTVVDGVTFDSKAEARRFFLLVIRARLGEINDLVLQPTARTTDTA